MIQATIKVPKMDQTRTLRGYNAKAKTLVSSLKGEIKEIRTTMPNVLKQNRFLVNLIKSENNMKSSRTDSSRVMYSKNIPWNNKDKHNQKIYILHNMGRIAMCLVI